MLQPYPLAIGEKLDFQFDVTELNDDEDTIASYVLTAGGNIDKSSPSESSNVITVWAEWDEDAVVGSIGWIEAAVTSTSGRILLKRMTFFASEPTT